LIILRDFNILSKSGLGIGIGQLYAVFFAGMSGIVDLSKAHTMCMPIFAGFDVCVQEHEVNITNNTIDSIKLGFLRIEHLTQV
jgi:hypothetical protein